MGFSKMAHVGKRAGSSRNKGTPNKQNVREALLAAGRVRIT